MNRPGGNERDSRTTYVLGVIAMLLAATVGVAGLTQAQSTAGRARAAVNLVAISGTIVLSSAAVPGDPRAVAQCVAAASGASVSAYSMADENATVSVVVPTAVLGRPCQATAQVRAGPVDAPSTP